MNIIACVKAVLDPAIPPAKFRVDSTANKVIYPEGMPPVISPYDANAVEVGLRLREANGGRLIAITAGHKPLSEAPRHAVAMGADEAVIVADAALENIDSRGTAYTLAQAIKKLGACDLILCGRQAADSDAGQVGSLIAGNLGLPLVTIARSVALMDGKLRVERVLTDGYQVFEVSLPAVITVGEECGQPRLPSGWGVINAARKQMPVWSLADIGADLSLIRAWAGQLKLQRLYIPVVERKCEIVSGESPADAAAKLAARLRQAGVI